METTLKQIYESPKTLVLEVKQEGILCQSVDPYSKWTPEDI